jgi:hypothetical protein
MSQLLKEILVQITKGQVDIARASTLGNLKLAVVHLENARSFANSQVGYDSALQCVHQLIAIAETNLQPPEEVNPK